MMIEDRTPWTFVPHGHRIDGGYSACPANRIPFACTPRRWTGAPTRFVRSPGRSHAAPAARRAAPAPPLGELELGGRAGGGPPPAGVADRDQPAAGDGRVPPAGRAYAGPPFRYARRGPPAPRPVERARGRRDPGADVSGHRRS